MEERKDYEEILLDKFRVKKIFTILGLSISGDIFIWTRKWIGFVTVEQQKYKLRFLEFDDGWSYSFYWSKWKEYWKHNKIIE